MSGRSWRCAALAGAAATLVLSACARGRLPPLSPASFPFAIDSLRATSLGRDGRHQFVYSASGPWAIHVLDLTLTRCQSVRAVKGAPGAAGRTKTSELMRALDDTVEVVGGVNADFFLFAPQGVPTGALVIRGRVVTPPIRRPVFAVDSAGRPHIVVLSRPTNDSLVVDDPRLRTMSLLPFHPMEAVGGRPRLLVDSAVSPDVDSVGGPGFATTRHPRTAVGIADGGKRLILVVVDGRQKPYSDGMTNRELAVLLRALGARDALNLDGGGSTAMVVADPARGDSLHVVSKPSDPTGERAVGDALAVVRSCRARR